MQIITASQRRWRWAVIVCSLVALTLPFLKNTLPWFPYLPCVFKDCTGLPCVLCGGTRAACAAVRGEWAYSLYLNPVSIPVLLGLMCAIAIAISENLSGRILIPWGYVLTRMLKLAPFLVVLLIFGWAAHIFFAVYCPKHELVDFSKSPAICLRACFVKWFENPSPRIE